MALPKSRSSRVPELDLLRAIAVLLVLGRHMPDVPSNANQFLTFLLSTWQRGGWIGVDLFFVLSGFLVSGLLFREYSRYQEIYPTRFFVRRGLKIYPAFYFFLISSLFLDIRYNDTKPIALTQITGEILFLQNYLGAIWNHTWSLAVEEHFYLLLLLVVMTLTRSKPRISDPFRFLPILIAGTGLCMVLLRAIIGGSLPVGTWPATLGYSHLRIDSLFFGVLLSYLYHFRFEKLSLVYTKYRIPILISSILFILPPFYISLEESRFNYTYGFTLLYIGFGNLMILFLTSNSQMKIIILSLAKPMIVAGRHSYSIYLWHMPMYFVMLWSTRFIPIFPGSYLLIFLGYLISSTIIGVIMSLIIEYPVLRLRDRIFPTRSGLIGNPDSISSQG